MFSGAHMVIFSAAPEADRALFAGLFPGRAVDAGEGWLIFPLPASEIAVHPSDGSTRHELHLMCDDTETTRAALADLGIERQPPRDMGFGIVSSFVLPGGSVVGFYQPRHERAT